MKFNKKGFMLVETLVVTTLVSTILVTLYVQFSNIINNFNRTFKYNSSDNLYAVYNIENFIRNDKNTDNTEQFYINLQKELDTAIANKTNPYHYVEINTSCTGSSGNVYQVFQCTNFSKIVNFYEIERILFTYSNVNFQDVDYQKLKSPGEDSNFEKFIKSIHPSTTNTDDLNNVENATYRLIVKFKDGEYATLNIIE